MEKEKTLEEPGIEREEQLEEPGIEIRDEDEEVDVVGDDETEGEPVKRARLQVESERLTADTSATSNEASTSDEEMFDFELTPHVDRRVRKFGLHMRNYTARIIQRGGGDLSVPIGQRPVLAQEMSAALQRAIQRHILTDDNVRDNDHLLINVNSDRLRNAYHSVRLTVRDWRNNTAPAQQVLQQLSDMLNSNEHFTMDDAFNMNISHVRDPGTGGTSRAIKLGLDPIQKILKDKKCVVQIKNTDNLCCARALVTAQAYRDFGSDHPRYKGLKNGQREQTEAAQELHRRAGVPEGPCGLDEITLFQSHLREYQLVIVSVEHGGFSAEATTAFAVKQGMTALPDTTVPAPNASLAIRRTVPTTAAVAPPNCLASIAAGTSLEKDVIDFTKPARAEAASPPSTVNGTACATPIKSASIAERSTADTRSKTDIAVASVNALPVKSTMTFVRTSATYKTPKR
ncbi:hypothetical protein ACROYT_G017567 [Oculina patagonica]